MTVAHDAQTRWPATDGTSTATGDQTFTHTPSGTPAGVALVVFNGGANANPLTGALYGGTAMALSTSQGEATEAGWVGIYTLTEDVPSGAQTVTLQGASAAAKWAMCSTVTAATAATTVNDTTVASSASGANPQVTMTTTIGTLSYGGVHSGAAAPVTTVLTGCTHQEDQDYGAKCAMAMRRTSQDAAGSPVIGYTLAADDYAICAVALGEFEPKNTAPTQVATATSGWNATTPKSAAGFSWQTGDDLYVIGMDADAPNNALGTPTITNLSGTDLTFAVISGFPIGGASNAEVYVWKATAGGSGSGDIQGTRTAGSDDWGIRVWQFRGSDGTGTVATLIDSTHLVSNTRANHHSRVICGIADWSADADVTVDPSPSSGGTVRDAVQTGGTGIATYFTVDWTDQGNAGTTSYGVANATGAGSKAKAAVEILGTVAAPERRTGGIYAPLRQSAHRAGVI